MSMVKHGRVRIRWCGSCDVPVIREKVCPSCGGATRGVEYTPPGDMRPAFPEEIASIRSMADSRWGSGAGAALLPGEGPYLINPSPARDRMDEVMRSGRIVAVATFDIDDLAERLLLRPPGAFAMEAAGFKPERGFVVADDSALPFLLGGASLLSPGILSASPGIVPGDEVLVIVEGVGIVGSGPSRKTSEEMVGTKGTGVKLRWCHKPEPFPGDPGMTWKDAWDKVLKVDSAPLKRMEADSVRFVKDTTARFRELPVAVSFSGGKDSLATLLVVMEAGLRPPVLFVDTGIEFPETVRYVNEVISDLGLDLLIERPATPFLEDALTFGPPGRDYRWCCKTCKLGPMTRLIGSHFPDGVLTFIGQRRFESDARERKGPVWENPWVPGQVGASPVQEWNALEVWLYILSKGARYNPLYAKGFNRIGCFLCPSTDLHERSLMEGTELDPAPWTAFLEDWRKRKGLPPEWREYGFHRFKRIPSYMADLRDRLGIDITPGPDAASGPPIMLVEGSKGCDHGLSREGQVSPSVPWDRLVELLSVLGRAIPTADPEGIDVIPEGWTWSRPAIELFRDGTLIVRGVDEKDIARRARDLTSVVLRAHGCVGCGVCVGRCAQGALTVSDGRIVLDPTRCIHCGSCLGPCPAESFRPEQGEDPST